MQTVLALINSRKDMAKKSIFYEKSFTSLNNERKVDIEKLKETIQGRSLVEIRKNHKVKKNMHHQRLMNENVKEEYKINSNINLYEKTAEEKNNMIKNQLEKQSTSINKKLEERREKSITKKNHKKSFLSNKSSSNFLNDTPDAEYGGYKKNNKGNLSPIHFDIWKDIKKEYFGN